MELIIYILFLFLAVLGLADLIHCLRIAMLDIRGEDSKVVCCILKGKCADLKLRFVIEQYNWFGRKYADKIIAISYLDNEVTAERCRLLANRYNVE
jgi:hypothetical protein